MRCFRKLGVDGLYSIFSQLPYVHLQRCRIVCRHWKQIIDSRLHEPKLLDQRAACEQFYMYDMAPNDFPQMSNIAALYTIFHLRSVAFVFGKLRSGIYFCACDIKENIWTNSNFKHLLRQVYSDTSVDIICSNVNLNTVQNINCASHGYNNGSEAIRRRFVGYNNGSEAMRRRIVEWLSTSTIPTIPTI